MDIGRPGHLGGILKKAKIPLTTVPSKKFLPAFGRSGHFGGGHLGGGEGISLQPPPCEDFFAPMKSLSFLMAKSFPHY